MTETIGPIYTDLARQANALQEELNKAHVGHCSCDQCQRVDAELMAAPSLDEQIATLRGERDEARQQRDDWQQRFEIETRIVDEVWGALGISTFEQAQGKHIATIVGELRQQLFALQGACEQLKKEAKAIVDGFHDEAINGVICTPLGDEEHGFPLWDAAPSRLWCARCKKRWERLFALPEKLAVLTAPPVPSETAEERK